MVYIMCVLSGLIVKRPLKSITSPSVSPSLLNNSLKTPLAHPSLRDIAATTKTLTNPPDLFLQPSQKRRNVRRNKEGFPDIIDGEEGNVHGSEHVLPTPPVSSKLIAVFPSTSDELDLEEVEIEHASSTLPPDSDSDSFLFGKSEIIPNLVLHENIDFSSLSQDAAGRIDEKDLESKLAIEPIFIEFKIEQ